MLRLNNRIRKYQSPSAKVTQMALESNFCETLRFNVQVDELHNINADKADKVKGDASDPLYFEF